MKQILTRFAMPTLIVLFCIRSSHGVEPAAEAAELVKSARERLPILRKLIKGNAAERRRLGTAIASDVEDVINELGNGRLPAKKHMLYAKRWQEYAREFKSDSIDDKTIEALDDFLNNLNTATQKKTCTVVVSAAKGKDAEIRYVKTIDASQGTNTDFFGITTAGPKEVERALYDFFSIRDDRPSGSLRKVDCTGEIAVIEIPEK